MLKTIGLGLLLLCVCAVLFVGLRNTLTARTGYQNAPALGQILRINGADVHALVAGEGPNVILVHGAGGNIRDFTFSMVDRLKDRYRVIVFDRPGHGYSSRIPYRKETGESIAEQADLLAAAARELGVKKAIIAGQSYGGAVMLSMALRHPEMAAGLVQIAGVSNPWEGPLDRWYQMNESWFGRHIFTPIIASLSNEKSVAETVSAIFAPDPVPEGYTDQIGVGLATRPSQLRANVEQVNRLKKDVIAQVERYGSITAPLEIVHGDVDKTVPLNVHSIPLSTQVPGANLQVLPGVGHMPHHAAEDEAIAAIDRAAKRAGLN